MFDNEQLVYVRWNNTNRDWYENHGYVYTKRNDIFIVKAKDLPVSSKAKVNAICDYCGNSYETNYSQIYQGRKYIKIDCCRKCTGKKSSDVSYIKRRTKYYQKFLNICNEYDYIPITTINEYSDIKMQVKYICPKHGEQSAMLENILHGHKCLKCSYEERTKAKMHDINYVISEIENTNNNTLINPDEYINCVSHNLRIRCSCGNIFTTSFVNYTKHHVNTCFSCSCKESAGESIIKSFLEEHDIYYEQEKRFDNCRDNKPLPFDFFLPTKNMIIEFDGRHHYERFQNWGNYDKTIEHDDMKNKYCSEHGITILRIPYWDGNKITKILTQQLL